MTSIVILTFNKISYTKKCIESIRKYTSKGSYEIIVVDNASTDGTISWLKEQSDIITIFNKDNLGFPKGCNQGIEIAQGSEILLLNNDVIVTPKWLEQMLEALYSSEKVGAVGPVTNYAPGQEITVTYQNEAEMVSFASEVTEKFKNKWSQKTKLIGFCLLFKKSVLDEVGLLDELFTPGNYEDYDISFRLLLAGYKLLLCHNVFIHHFGSISFGTDNRKFDDLLRENKLKFLEKWKISEAQLGVCRKDLINLMNLTQNDINILEIGCGIGKTLLEIKNINATANLYAIEKNEQAAMIARNFSEVIIGDVEKIELPYQEKFFDYIILDDVLECIYNYEELIFKIRKIIKNGGKLLVSCKNVQNSELFKNLLEGKWQSKIIKSETIRFFTINELEKIFDQCGYRIIKYVRIIDENENEIKEFNKKLIESAIVDDIFNFEAYQWVIELRLKTEDNIDLKITKLLNDLQRAEISDSESAELVKYLINLEVNAEELFLLINDMDGNTEKTIVEIATSLYKYGYEIEGIKLLLETYKRYNESIDIIYTLAFLLNLNGDKASAIKLLENVKIKDIVLDELLNEVKGSDVII